MEARPFAYVLGPALAVAVSSVALAADTTPPSRISDLRVTGGTRTALTLSWTAPGDDGGSGTAARYEVRRSARPIVTEADWGGAVPMSGLPSPLAAGTAQSGEIAGLEPATIHYLALRAADEAGNLGAISNEATGNTRYDGYGSGTLGGSGGQVCHVTSLADSGAGSLRACLDTAARVCAASGPRTVVFDVGGTITLMSDIVLGGDDCKLTIDGGTAPAPGITLRKRPCASGLTACPVGDPCLTEGEFKIGVNDAVPASDVIVSRLRVQGNYLPSWGACLENSGATLGLQYHIRNVVLDRLTLRNGPDASPDLWTGTWDASDVTISRSLLLQSNHPLTISDSDGTGTRRRISLLRNVLADSGERMPNVLGDTSDLEIRNNVVSNWNATGAGAYASRIRNQDGAADVPKVAANVVGNQWIPGSGGKPRQALVYGEGPGSSSSSVDGDGGPPECTTSDSCSRCPAQGTVVTTSFLGELHVAGNLLPKENCDHWSTVPGERPVPAEDAAVTVPASDLRTVVLPAAGAPHRTADEQAVFDRLDGAMSADADADGLPDLQDCRPQDPEGGVPPEVSGLTASGGASTHLAWAAAPRAETYDVSRVDLDALGGPYGPCLARGLGGTSVSDPEIPAPKRGFAYLVRGVDLSCGAGPWGRSSDGGDRRAGACP